MKKPALILLVCAFIGCGAAFAVTSTTTGTVSVCATTPAETIAVNSTAISTVPATTNCATTTYTIPTVTVTTTAAASATVALGSALPAPLPQSAGPTVTGSPTQPLQTLFDTLTPGETLCLHTGTYGAGLTASVTLSVSGTASAPITVTSCPGETATIAQLVKVTGSYIRLAGLNITRNSYPTDTRYGQSGTNPGGNVGIWITGSHDTLEHSNVYGNTMSGVFGSGSYAQILANQIHDNGTTPDDHGIYWAGDHGLIANNVVQHNYAFGIQIGYTSATGNTVANNTIAYNGSAGTTAFSGTTNNLLVNNISAFNGSYGYTTYDSGAVTLSHDDSWSNPSGDLYGTFASSPLKLNPGFVSSTDLHPASGSPVKAAGDPAYTPPTDINGNTRTGADLGAYSAP